MVILAALVFGALMGWGVARSGGAGAASTWRNMPRAMRSPGASSGVFVTILIDRLV